MMHASFRARARQLKSEHFNFQSLKFDGAKPEAVLELA